MDSSKTGNILRLIVSVLICEAAGAVGAIFTTPAIPTWYATLEKPSFNPPNWLFAPVWTLLYLLMGVAVFLVWRQGWDKRQVKVALTLFLAQLILNVLWSGIFFGLESPFYGLMVIILLWVAILVTAVTFFRIIAVAGWLMLPYLLWTSFATILNISIWILNP